MKFQNDFFEQTAQKYPNYIAVDDHNKKITYKNLDIYSNKIANLLKENGCKYNDRIIVFTGKNINQYASVLGILKSGSCWVPISYLFPDKRINFLIKDIKPRFIITEKIHQKRLSKLTSIKNILVLDSDDVVKKNFLSKKEVLKEKKTKPILLNPCTSNLAYIIFTSGSTGNPKGVMVTHENTSQFLKNSDKYFKPKKKLRFAHISDLTFDVSIFDIFICWLNAGTIIPFNQKSYKINPLNFFKKNKNLNVIFVVPSFLQKIKDITNFKDKSLKNIKHLVLTGEPIPKNLIPNFYKEIKNTNIYNCYGTTETAIISHWYKIPKKIKLNDTYAVGKLLPNLQMLLLNDNKKNEVKGEAVVCGSQISIGYWNNQFQTERYFIKYSENKLFYQKYYRTGDYLSKRRDGLYYYEGRTDNQVKIRGHRIELEELDNFIKNIINVIDVKSIAYSRTGISTDLELFSFIRTESKKLNKSKVLDNIENNLPKYMSPSNIFFSDLDFKRNQNGKVDKKELIKIILKNVL